MPIYEYLCGACGEKFSVFLKSSSAQTDAKCPRCDSRELRKVMSSFSCSGSSGSGGGGCSHKIHTGGG